MEKLYGLIGEKLGHTLSPQIHSEILQFAGIEGHYATMEVKRNRLPDVVPGLKALGFAGINVTIPYKTDIIPYLDCLSPEAEKIGAVNVVDICGDKATGYNTDYYGFGMMLKEAGICAKGKNVLILGTGGASRAVAQYLTDEGAAEIAFMTRDVSAASLKYPDCKIISYSETDKIKDGYLLVNCTPVGMYPCVDASPADKNLIERFAAVVDLIYNPAITRLSELALSLGLKAVNGLFMLTGQAVKSQEIWNKTSFPASLTVSITERLREAL